MKVDINDVVKSLLAEAARWRRMGGSGETVHGFTQSAEFLVKEHRLKGEWRYGEHNLLTWHPSEAE